MKYLSVFASVLVSLCFVSCSKVESMSLANESEFRISLNGKDVAYEFFNSLDQSTVGLLIGGESVSWVVIRQNGVEYFHKYESDGMSVIIADKDGDGLPDERLTENITTGEVSRSVIDSIKWKAAR